MQQGWLLRALHQGREFELRSALQEHMQVQAYFTFTVVSATPAARVVQQRRREKLTSRLYCDLALQGTTLAGRRLCRVNLF